MLARFGSVLASLAALACLAAEPALAGANVPAGDAIGPLPGWPDIKAQSTSVEEVCPGVTLSSVQLLTSTEPLHIYQLDVDLTAPGIRLSSVLSQNSVVSTGETVSSMAARTGALAGINADYFAIHTSGVPLNWTVQNGNLIRSGNHWAVFAFTDERQVNIGKYTWQGSLKVLKSGATFPIEALNLPLMDHKIIAINQSMGSPLAAWNGTLVYLTPDKNGQYLVSSVQQGQSVVPPVNGDTVVLAGEGVAATWLALNVPNGSRLQLDYASHPDWHDLQTAVGGGPILVQNGYPYQDPEAPAAFETNRPYPVSGVGISQDGRHLMMVVVDGHEGKPYRGLTRPQFGWYFQTIGAWNAMAFDSGGSAQMVVRHPGQPAATIVNSPSDGRERPVADGLFIYG
ncbi:MAG TPA: phosphodiester glycosidase family protein [Chloroflexota bacterium]|nr:phosphodiester glycosidase family protein [Chloroflexota bacterium]